MAKPKMRQLPIVFRALDLDGVTKPIATAVCPVRGDLMTVGICGLCQDFRRIVFDEHARPIVCCIGPDESVAIRECAVRSISQPIYHSTTSS